MQLTSKALATIALIAVSSIVASGGLDFEDVRLNGKFVTASWGAFW